MSKFSLLKSVDEQVKAQKAEEAKQKEHDALVVEAFNSLAEEQKTTGEKLFEAVTHVLANIIATASQGAPIKAMNASSLAGFMAGVETLAMALPKSNEQQKANALKVLQAASIGPDGLVTTSVASIAQLGAKKPDLSTKYAGVVNKYLAAANSKTPDAGKELVTVARQLQAAIDRAMRGGTTPSQELNARVARVEPPMSVKFA